MTSQRRLKSTEIKAYREALLKEQGYKCALSQIDLTPERAVLDHDHRTGLVRAVLDRGVNALLGKIENGMQMNRIDLDMLHNICVNLIDYIQNSHKDIYHHTHRSPEENRQRIKKRAQSRRKKTK